ncbi:MAG: O-antigen ligase family protein, partial [Microthrixaceae bacterium]|nr:O-antigen ligase family protein [Microthrixaceae bacterium]
MEAGFLDRASQAVSVWVPALVVGLVPIVVLPGAFAPFHAGKWFAVSALIPLGLVACAIRGVLRWPRWQWFAAWVGVNALAMVLGVAPWLSLAGSPNRNAGVLAVLLGCGAFVLGASTGDDPRVQRLVLRAAFISGAIVGVLAIMEWLGVDLLGLGDLDQASRARSTWGNAAFAGAHFVIVLPIAVAHMRSRDRTWRILAIASTVAIGLGLLLTGTRAAWVAAAVAAVIMAPSWRAHTRPRSADEPREIRSNLTPLIIGAVVIIGSVVIMAPNLTRSSAAGRVDQWRTAIPVIIDRPVLGSGPDTGRVVLPSGIDESFEQKHGSTELHDRVHNVVLDTAVTTGLIGVVVLGALLVVLITDIRRGLHNEIVPTAIAAGLAGYLVTLLFGFGDPIIDPIVWLLAGVLLASSSSRSLVSGRAAEPGTASPGRIPRGATAGVLAVVTVMAALWAGGEVLAEYRLSSAMDARRSGDLAGSLDILKGASRLAPARFDLDQISSRIVTQALVSGTPIDGQRGSTTM